MWTRTFRRSAEKNTSAPFVVSGIPLAKSWYLFGLVRDYVLRPHLPGVCCLMAQQVRGAFHFPLPNFLPHDRTLLPPTSGAWLKFGPLQLALVSTADFDAVLQGAFTAY